MSLLPARDAPWQTRSPHDYQWCLNRFWVTGTVAAVVGWFADRAWSWWHDIHTIPELLSNTYIGWVSVILAYVAAGGYIIAATGWVAAGVASGFSHIESRRLNQYPTVKRKLRHHV